MQAITIVNGMSYSELAQLELINALIQSLPTRSHYHKIWSLISVFIFFLTLTRTCLKHG